MNLNSSTLNLKAKSSKNKWISGLENISFSLDIEIQALYAADKFSCYIYILFKKVFNKIIFQKKRRKSLVFAVSMVQKLNLFGVI